MNSIKRNINSHLFPFIGPFLYACGVNLFIVPLNLYSGGIVGICQIVRTLLSRTFNLNFTFDIAGIFAMLVNIPLLFVAHKMISKKFFGKTVLSIIAINVFLTIIHIKTPIIDDVLSSCLIGGALSGVGYGLTLRGGSSTGGTDIIGMYLVKKNKKLSIGQLNFIIDGTLYLICACLFNIETAIYSIIFSMVCSFTIDKIHSQNIKMNAIIFTDNYQIAKEINARIPRGSTSWEGKGDYTGNKKYIISTVITKYEVEELKSIINELDPNAFVTINKIVDNLGYMEKHLDA